MYCEKCGSLLNDDAKFCRSCGAPTATSVDAEQNEGIDNAENVVANTENQATEDFNDSQTMKESKSEYVATQTVDTAQRNTQTAAMESLSGMYNAASTSIKNMGLSTMQKASVICAGVASLGFLCGISMQWSWISLIAGLFLVFLLIKKEPFDSKLTATAITVFEGRFILLSLRNALFYHYAMNFQDILLILVAIFVVVSAWLLSNSTENNKKTMSILLLCGIGVMALFDVISLLSSLSGIYFKWFAYLIGNVAIESAFIINIINSGAFGLANSGTIKSANNTFNYQSVGNNQENVTYEKVPHPYQELGGWLKAIVVIGYIGVVLMIIECVLLDIQLFQTMSFISNLGGQSGILVVTTILSNIAFIIAAVIEWKFITKIKEKDSSFLWYYHKLCIFAGIAIVILAGISNGFASAIGSLLELAIVAFLWTLYFVKSVRVRTYMGSDEYLRVDPLTRNVKSPIPADIVIKSNQEQTSANEAETNNSLVCQNCGNALQEGVSFCNKCGTPVKKVEQEEVQ